VQLGKAVGNLAGPARHLRERSRRVFVEDGVPPLAAGAKIGKRPGEGLWAVPAEVHVTHDLRVQQADGVAGNRTAEPGKNSSVTAAPPTICCRSGTRSLCPARARYQIQVSPVCPPPTITRFAMQTLPRPCSMHLQCWWGGGTAIPQRGMARRRRSVLRRRQMRMASGVQRLERRQEADVRNERQPETASSADEPPWPPRRDHAPVSCCRSILGASRR
jgi:hypothetical protein